MNKNDKVVKSLNFGNFTDINTGEKFNTQGSFNITDEKGNIVRTESISSYAATAIADTRVKEANNKVSGLYLEINKRRILSKELRKEKGNFMFIFLEWFKKVSGMKLSGRDYDVLMFILSKMEFNSNEFKMTQEKITEEMNKNLDKKEEKISRSTVTRCLQRLTDKGIIFRVEGGKEHYYFVNPDVGFCGSMEYAENIYLNKDEDIEINSKEV